MLDKKYILAAGVGAALISSVGVGALAFAQTAANTSTTGTATAHPGMHRPGVGGTVTAVSGNTVTIKDFSGTSYTVDASAATVTKEVTATISDVKVGDTIMAGGTVTGTSVAATMIHDGKMPPMSPKGMGMHRGGMMHDNDGESNDDGPSTATPTTTQ